MTRFEVWKRKVAKEKVRSENKFIKALDFSRHIQQAMYHPIPTFEELKAMNGPVRYLKN